MVSIEQRRTLPGSVDPLTPTPELEAIVCQEIGLRRLRGGIE